MTLDWFWETEEGFIALMVGCLFVLIAMYVIAVQISNNEKQKKEYELNKACGLIDNTSMPQITAEAKVISRYTSACPTVQNLVLNNITFETEDGSRLAFTIKDEIQYNQIAEGDFGVLTYQGKKFIRFERKTT